MSSGNYTENAVHKKPSEMAHESNSKPWDLGTVTIATIETPIANVMQAVAMQVGVSISIPKEADEEQTVTADYTDQQAQRVFEDLASKIEMVAEYDGSIVTFTTPDKATKDFIVLRTGYADAEVAEQTMQAMLGDEANVDVIDDRLVVTGSRGELEQATDYAKHFNSGRDGWLLDVRVVTITKLMRRELGLDWDLEANIGLNTTGPGYMTNADLLVSVIGRAVQTGTDAKLLQTATLYVLEGSGSQITQGQKIPVPRFQTSPEGTTTTAGFEYIEAGFKLEAQAKRVPGGVQLDLSPSISSVVGYVEQAPITQQSSAEVQVVVDSGEWIIITGLDTVSSSNESKKIPGMPAPIFGTNNKSDEETALLILVQAKRVFTAQIREN